MFDLNDLNPAQRFYYDDKEVEWVELRLVTDEKYKEFKTTLAIKQKREVKFDKAGRPVYLDSLNIDEEKTSALSDLANDYMIADWHLVDKQNNEIECTSEIKKKMLFGCPAFSTFIDKCIKKMKETDEVHQEEVEKNQKRSQKLYSLRIGLVKIAERLRNISSIRHPQEKNVQNVFPKSSKKMKMHLESGIQYLGKEYMWG